jgi:F-type H+-transporting ATPase subunit epsilon
LVKRMAQSKYFTLEIITPDRPILRESVSQVKAPGKEGLFGVRVNHIASMIELTVGQVDLQTVNGDRTFTISGGIAEIGNNVMKILTESAENAETIDRDRAERSRQRALTRLQEKKETTDLARARASLARSLNRLNASSRYKS